MRSLPLVMLLALPMSGCGEEAKQNRSLALLIPCEACGENVSKNTEKSLNCSDPAPTFVFDLEDALARIKTEQEREVATGASKSLKAGFNGLVNGLVNDDVDWGIGRSYRELPPETRTRDSAGPGPSVSDDLELILRFPHEKMHGNILKMTARESLRATAMIHNKGKRGYTLVLPGDGSNFGWRTPVVGFSSLGILSQKKHPREVPLFKGSRCGNINTIKEHEVFVLKPRETKPLGGWVGYLEISKPGKYRVAFHYNNIPSLRISGMPLGRNASGIKGEIRESTPVYLLSNEVIVEVEAEPSE